MLKHKPFILLIILIVGIFGAAIHFALPPQAPTVQPALPTFSNYDLARLNLLYSKLPLKDRCRWEDELGLVKWNGEELCSPGEQGWHCEGLKRSSTGDDCTKFLEKTESHYVIP